MDADLHSLRHFAEIGGPRLSSIRERAHSEFGVELEPPGFVALLLETSELLCGPIDSENWRGLWLLDRLHTSDLLLATSANAGTESSVRLLAARMGSPPAYDALESYRGTTSLVRWIKILERVASDPPLRRQPESARWNEPAVAAVLGRFPAPVRLALALEMAADMQPEEAAAIAGATPRMSRRDWAVLLPDAVLSALELAVPSACPDPVLLVAWIDGLADRSGSVLADHVSRCGPCLRWARAAHPAVRPGHNLPRQLRKATYAVMLIAATAAALVAFRSSSVAPSRPQPPASSSSSTSAPHALPAVPQEAPLARPTGSPGHTVTVPAPPLSRPPATPAPSATGPARKAADAGESRVIRAQPDAPSQPAKTTVVAGTTPVPGASELPLEWSATAVVSASPLPTVADRVNPETPDSLELRTSGRDSRSARLLNVAVSRHRRGSESATLQVIARALRLEPTLAEGHYDAALLYDILGNKARARAHWKRYLELVPDAADSAAVRQRLEK